MRLETNICLYMGQVTVNIFVYIFPSYIGLPKVRKGKGFWELNLILFSIHYTDHDKVYERDFKPPIEGVMTTTQHEEPLVVHIPKTSLQDIRQ